MTRNAVESPATIHDVARHLKVSSTTVWRALNNSPRVSSLTRDRVIRAASEMNYRPSLLAQTLLRGKSQTLGVVVPMIGNPVYASLVRAVEQIAFEHKYSMILCDTDFRLDREREYIDLLVRRRVEGIAVIPFAARDAASDSDYDHLTALPRQGVPVVTLQQSVPGGQLDSIVPDNREAARAMTAHLIGLGHRRVGFLHGGMPSWNVGWRERFDGYCLALEQAAIPVDPSLVLEAGSFASSLTDDPGAFRGEAVKQYLMHADRPTAVFAPVDVLAIKIMEVAKVGLGLRVPQDLAIAGFDDIFMSAHTSPPLTTVRHPAAEIGQRAARRLFDQFGESNSKSVTTEVRSASVTIERIPCQLIIRQSCGAGVDGSA